MNPATTELPVEPSRWQVPAPVLFNTWKHHAGALRQRIADVTSAGETGLTEFSRQLVVLGTELMDLYTGTLAPAEIAAKVLAALAAQGQLQPDACRAWLEA